ncbi:MAG TPA: FlgD immunoglobulin-like domain containing protein [Candidatus Bathyarchaeia archaeon]|nr:FlgD immunoglobulin-like domain containing protein [Candidatus Bathyarchaeia archaeon]
MKHAKVVAILLTLMNCAAAPALEAAWVANGVAICTVPGTEDAPVIVSDGSGGAIVVWVDGRTVVNTDIYAQRINAGGSVLWPANGNPVCNYNNSQSSPLVVTDGSGGAIVAWQDFRSNNVLDVYAQRVNSSGYGIWTANGVAICTGQMDLTLSQMIADGSGGAIIVWSDRRNANYDIFAQKINSTGAIQWAANGATVCSTGMSQLNPALTSDGSGGAIITWQDNRSDANDIYAQRITSAGAAQWTANGVVVCSAAQSQRDPQIVPDGSGGAIIAWTDHRNTLDDDVYAQRLDASGAPQWTADGVGVASWVAGDQSGCRTIPDGSGGAIVAWLDTRNDATADIYAERIDASGAGLWAANGVAVCAAANGQTALQLIPSVSGGAIAAWQDERGASGVWDIYAQRINASGTMAWASNGVVISAASGNQTAPRLALDGVGGAFATWTDMRAGNADIYAQRADAAGHTVAGTTLQAWSAAADGPDITIEWTLADTVPGIEFMVLRSCGRAEEFAEMHADGVSGVGRSFTFADRSCEPGQTYRSRIDARVAGALITLFETGPIRTPAAAFALYQNHPNPFNPSTTIRFSLSEPCAVSLAVYDASGALVRRLFDGRAAKGSRAVEWNGLDDGGRPATSGVYFCKLKAGKETSSRTMILLR